jgi:hypothetical protein
MIVGSNKTALADPHSQLRTLNISGHGVAPRQFDRGNIDQTQTAQQITT